MIERRMRGLRFMGRAMVPPQHALSVPQDRPEQFVVRLEHELGPQGYEILDADDGLKFFLSDVSRLGIRSNALVNSVAGQTLSVTVRHVATQETETLSVAVTAPVGTGGGDGNSGGGGGTASGDPYYQCLLLW